MDRDLNYYLDGFAYGVRRYHENPTEVWPTDDTSFARGFHDGQRAFRAAEEAELERLTSRSRGER